MWYVYMVLCSDNSLYTGISKDVNARVHKHNAGTGARYTRARRPVALVYQQPAGGHGDALRREHIIRKLSPSEKRKLANGVIGDVQPQTSDR